jgi:hypothetical protein
MVAGAVQRSRYRAPEQRRSGRLLAPGTVTLTASAWGGSLIDLFLGARTDTAVLTITE